MTHGSPSSRLTITEWLSAAPTSTTTALALTNNGVHDGSVSGATSTSPGDSAVGSLLSSTTRARPRAMPGQPGKPASVSPAESCGSSDAPRRGHSDIGGGSPTMTNGS